MTNMTLYCDGGCRGNGKVESLGSWAYVVLDKDENVIESKGLVDDNCSTNIRAEMLALAEGLKATLMATDISEINHLNIDVYTDSKFICDCFNKGWVDNWIRNGWVKKNKEPVANKDLWEMLLALEATVNHIEYNHVKGHNGDYYNEMCDKLVNIAMDDYLRGEK